MYPPHQALSHHRYHTQQGTASQTNSDDVSAYVGTYVAYAWAERLILGTLRTAAGHGVTDPDEHPCHHRFSLQVRR
jgi:hypothetical protein